MAYLLLNFGTITAAQSDELVAQLAELPFTGFEETEGFLKAYININDFTEDIQQVVEQLGVLFQKEIIEEQNWNELWESNFSPVVVDDFVAVRASFHEPIKGVKQEIVITPKMSFGTGHHATTFMMMQQMRDIDFAGKKVLDFGTGTGVLAILAEKLGAKNILANDIDDWSIENSRENIANNDCTNITIERADSANTNRQYDIILANINRTVILDNMAIIASQLNRNALVLLSGLLVADREIILAEAAKNNLHLIKESDRNGWISLLLR